MVVPRNAGHGKSLVERTDQKGNRSMYRKGRENGVYKAKKVKTKKGR